MVLVKGDGAVGIAEAARLIHRLTTVMEAWRISAMHFFNRTNQKCMLMYDNL